MYIKSNNIKFYPSAYRYYVDNGVSVVTDEEASRNTEYNITSHIAKVFHSTKGSFIISEDDDENLEFFIGGYYVKVDSVATNLLSNFSSATDIYANIKTALVTPSPTQGNWDNLFEVVEFEHEYKPLDYKSGNNIEFKGISFEDSENANATFSLHLFTIEDTNSPFTLVASSKFILTLGDILGNDGKSALDELKTRTLLATTINGENATFSGTVGAVNVNVGNQLTVTNKIVLGASSITLNNGAFVFDNDITFASAKNVGTSSVPVNDIYATNINLGTSLVPTSQTVNLGATNNKINTIYANDIYSQYFRGSLLGNAYSADRIKNTLRIQLSAGAGSVTNMNCVIQTGTTLVLDLPQDIGGNAATATKLNSTEYIGGSYNPVFFSNGVPVVSQYNQTFYNLVRDFSRFDRVLVKSDNTNPIYAEFSDSYVVNSLIYITIYRNPSHISMIFIRSSSAGVSTTYRVADTTFRLAFYDGLQGTRITLQWLSGSNWNTASETIETAVIMQLGRI